MRQLTLASQGSFEQYGKQTRREKFLEEMERIMAWAEFGPLIEQHEPREDYRRSPVDLSILLYLYFQQSLR